MNVMGKDEFYDEQAYLFLVCNYCNKNNNNNNNNLFAHERSRAKIQLLLGLSYLSAPPTTFKNTD